IGDFGRDGAVSLDRLNHRAELGKFTRQLDVSLGRKIGGQLAFHQGVAVEQGVELLLRQSNHSCRPSAAAKLSSLWRIDTLPTGCDKKGRIACSPLRQSSSSISALIGPTADGDNDSARYPRIAS